MEDAETMTADVQQDYAEPTPEDSSSASEEDGQVKQVPLSALQKQRKKTQEEAYARQVAEQELEKLRNQSKEDDYSRYESVTKEDLENYSNMSRQQIIQAVNEERWVSDHPDRVDLINERLPELLKRKPYLSLAIQQSTNKYQEAWDQLVGHGKIENKQTKKQTPPENKAPPSAANMPKSAGLKQGIDLMGMSDNEFNKWRAGQRRRR